LERRLQTISRASDRSHYNLIENCELAYGGHHTLGVYSRYNVIRNNYTHNETNPEEWKFPGYRAAVTQGSAGGRCLWEGNRFAFADTTGLALRSNEHILRRNRFYLNGQGGVQIVSNHVTDSADNNRIYHNTFHHNGYREKYRGYQGGLYFANWKGVSAKGNVVKNNLFYDNRNGSVIAIEGPTDPQVIENNSDNRTDPLFVNPNNTGPRAIDQPDFQLTDNSPHIDKGTWLTSITSADGNGRSFEVKDASYFMDGWGIVESDRIQLRGTKEPVAIAKVNYATGQINVERPVQFRRGQPVALAYSGSAPDLGAFELAEK
jgi:hypothetical protein